VTRQANSPVSQESWKEGKKWQSAVKEWNHNRQAQPAATL
jgi:hypothetical protein